MKILVVGEYSGFAKYLSRGLRLLGHEPFVFSWGDSFKSIVQDGRSYNVNVRPILVFGHRSRVLSKLREIMSALKLSYDVSHMKKEFDCAFIINFGFLQLNNNILKPRLTFNQIRSLLLNQDNIFLSACGGDYIYYRYYVEGMRDKICQYELEKAKSSIPIIKTIFISLIPKIKTVIPITIDYEIAYKYFEKEMSLPLGSIIPLPFDVDSVSFSNDIKDKIVVFHGVNRYYAKGSDHIIPAMEQLKKKYPNKVNIVVVERVPLNDYLRMMSSANIVVDQCYGCSSGMNAVEAMAMGKVVLGGNEPGNAESFGEKESPAINIKPDKKDIYAKLEELVLNPDKIRDLSVKSREYVCRVHDCKKVAAQYVELFKEKDNNS